MPAHRVNKRVYTRPVNAHTQARDCESFRVPHLTAKTAASAGFWLGGQCPVAARGEENFESSVVSLHRTPPSPPFRKLLFLHHHHHHHLFAQIN